MIRFRKVAKMAIFQSLSSTAKWSKMVEPDTFFMPFIVN